MARLNHQVCGEMTAHRPPASEHSEQTEANVLRTPRVHRRANVTWPGGNDDKPPPLSENLIFAGIAKVAIETKHKALLVLKESA